MSCWLRALSYKLSEKHLGQQRVSIVSLGDLMGGSQFNPSSNQAREKLFGGGAWSCRNSKGGSGISSALGLRALRLYGLEVGWLPFSPVSLLVCLGFKFRACH